MILCFKRSVNPSDSNASAPLSGSDQFVNLRQGDVKSWKEDEAVTMLKLLVGERHRLCLRSQQNANHAD